MKNICINYEIFNSKVNKNIVSISDLHDYPGKRKNTLVDDIQVLNPDFVLIAGDIIASHKYVVDGESYKNLERFLSELSELCPVILGLGNHDLYKAELGMISTYRDLSKVRPGRVFALSNEAARYDDVRIIEFHPRHSSFAPSIQDSGRALLEFAEDYERYGMTPDENDSVFNILLCHNQKVIAQAFSPNFYRKLDISQEQLQLIENLSKNLKCFDMSNGGHLHNGYVFIDSVLSNPADHLDYGYWEMSKEKDINGNIKSIRPWVYKKTDMCRGTIYLGDDGKKLIQMPNGGYYYRNCEEGDYIPVDDDSALIIIENEIKNPPMIIDGGVNKFFNFPIDKSEITNIKVLKR